MCDYRFHPWCKLIIPWHRRRSYQHRCFVLLLLYTGKGNSKKLSLFIILFSQLTSFITTLATHTVPDVNFFWLAVMCFGAISGAIIGSAIAKKMDNAKTELFFRNLLIALIALNVYNIYTAL